MWGFEGGVVFGGVSPLSFADLFISEENFSEINCGNTITSGAV